MSSTLVALLLLTACHDADRQDEARAVDAVRQRVPGADALRVYRRSGLSTATHRVLRVVGDDGLDVTLVVDAASVRFAGDPATLRELLRDEKVAERLPELGRDKVAAWIGALGDGTCGAPVDEVRQRGAELSFRFAGVTGWRECTVELGPDGTPVRIRSRAVG